MQLTNSKGRLVVVDACDVTECFRANDKKKSIVVKTRTERHTLRPTKKNETELRREGRAME